MDGYEIAVLDCFVPPDNCDAWILLYEILFFEQITDKNASDKFPMLLDDLEKFDLDYYFSVRSDSIYGLTQNPEVFLMNIHKSDVGELLPSIVDAAVGLDLVVMDFQSRQVYRGNGETLAMPNLNAPRANVRNMWGRVSFSV